MALAQHQKTTFVFSILAILLIIFLELDFISFWSASATTYHLAFLNYKPNSTSHRTTMAGTSPSEYPDPLVGMPTGKHDSTLILLHGTSQDGPAFGEAFLSFPILGTKTLPELLPNTKFIFPTGRLRYCTVLGRESHAWFDFVSFADRTLGEDGQIEGLKESSQYLGRLIESEVESLAGQMKKNDGVKEDGVDGEMDSGKQAARRRIVVGGFSQGAAMACIGMLSGVLGGYQGGRIGGFVGLSGWCPFRVQILDAISAAEKQLTTPQKLTQEQKFVSAVLYVSGFLGLKGLGEGDKIGAQPIPVFLGHGGEDTKMKPEWGRGMRDLLGSMMVDVRWEIYEGLGHWWDERETSDLVRFLESVWRPEENRARMKNI